MVNPEGRAGICLVCEHASSAIPESLSDLGLAAADRYSHAVWDIGAEALARRLSGMLDAPLVLGRLSRLVHDCNRPPEAIDSIPARTERIEVPGNRGLSDDARSARATLVYDPFHRLVSDTLDAFVAAPAMATVHSFTPAWFGQPRTTEIGLLHDSDDRLARAMLAAADPELEIALNQPYSASDGVTHTLKRHAIARGLNNVMIEVRNDLLDDDAAVERMARTLSDMLTSALARGMDAA